MNPIGAWLITVFSAVGALAQATLPAPAPVPLPPTTAPADSMPKETLAPLYERELGNTYNSAQLQTLYDAHLWIERYFASTSSEDHKTIAKMLQNCGVEPRILGRLARIRVNWPQLQDGVYIINERIGPFDVHYFMGVPKGYDRVRPWPLVIKLPTAHAFVTDPPPGPDEVARIYTGWIEEELARHPDAVVIMPLLNLNDGYGPSYPGMNSVMQAMFHVAGRANIDPARIYMTGHSMSAHAVWNLALNYTTWFAAINPLAGGAAADWQRLRLMNLRNVLPVVWHDADDMVIKVDSSRQLVKVLRSLKYDVEYEETKSVGHAPSDEIAERCYQKMRSRTRELYPRQISMQSNRPDTIFNRLDWVQVYQPLRIGKEKRLLFRRGNGFMMVNEAAYTIDASLAGPNRIEAKTDNVELMRFYLNDQMVDLTKPVTVIINGKQRFSGMAQTSVDEMLKDQQFLGRGWRYFTAVIDIDLGQSSAPNATTAPAGPATRPKLPDDLKRQAEELKRRMREQESEQQ